MHERSWHRFEFPMKVALVTAVLLVAPGLTPAPVSADEVPGSGGFSTAEASFQTFAESWMARLARVEAQNRRSPSSNPATGVNYRGFGEDFRVELRSTGNPDSPYVGVLRYLEHVYQCSDAQARHCQVASRTPIAELFRFRDGAWIY